MKTKFCWMCNENKSIDEFFNNKSKPDGKSTECKKCCKIRAMNKSKTIDGLIYNIYHDQKKACKHRHYNLPAYTKEEFKKWILSQPNFQELYSNWVDSGYSKWSRPSVDRKDDYVSYTLNNIQLMTWKGNFDKGHLDRIEGRNNKYNKAVLQYDLNNNFIAEYHSIIQAERETGVANSNISATCLGKYKTMNGFIWKYKK